MADKPNRAQQAGAIVRNVGAGAWDRAMAAAGNAIRTALPMVSPGAMIPLQAALPLVTTQAGRESVRDFTRGVSGTDGEGAAAVAPPRLASTVLAERAALRQPSAAAAAVAPAMREPTAQDRAMAAIDSILSKPFTMRQFSAATAALPGVTQAGVASTKVAPKMKDTVLGATAELSQSIFAQEIAQAQAMKAADPKGAQDAAKKATDAYFQRNAGLVGFNPSELLQAQLLSRGMEEAD